MNKFSWYKATSVNDALEKVNATVSENIQPSGPKNAAVFKAGGVDLIDLMKEGIASPEMLINIRDIEGLDGIEYDEKEGLRLGANTTLSEIEYNEDIKSSYLALHQAVAHAGTPQLRNLATIGGNLAQRTRCWYFRSIDHECFRKGSGICFARDGENAFHAIMRNGVCASVHASSVATALMAFNAKVEIVNSKGEKRQVSLDDFFVHPGDDSRRENILQANELITAVVLPAVSNRTASYYLKQGARESHDWAMADVAVVAEMAGVKCRDARIVLGAAAPIPILAQEAQESIIGNNISEDTAARAGELSMKGATPLAKNGYKVPLFKALVKRSLLNLV